MFEYIWDFCIAPYIYIAMRYEENFVCIMCELQLERARDRAHALAPVKK